MITLRTFPYTPIFGFGALVCFVASYWFAFQAGCAGDPKTGTLGNPVRALEIEAQSVSFFLLGLLAVVALIALRRGVALHDRIKYSLAFLFLGSPLLWLLAIQVELWGTKQCF